MIKTKQDLQNYLACDKAALGITKKHPKPFRDDVWRYERVLRYAEFYSNLKGGGIFLRIKRLYYNSRHHSLGIKLGFSIPLNVFGPGLCIVHPGTIVVAGGATIGRNCRIHEGVTIGATNGQSKAATIGNNVFIASGAKIIGDIEICDDVAIGANAVVVNSVLEPCTVGGIPAKVISKNTSILNLKPLSEEMVD